VVAHALPFATLTQDDVAFFWPGLLRMLAGLDPDDPYFISGAVQLGVWDS
jgi:hypothetical protein